MRKFILGTDWCEDCDDVVALRILCKKVLSHEIELSGIVINACMEYSAASVDGFLAQHHIYNIPIGIDREAAADIVGENNAKYQKRMAAFAKKIKNNDEAEDAVRLYRRLLANSDEPIEIIEIGFLQAVAKLLESGADDISPLSGIDLVKSKVRKFWVMAGKWDEAVGHEYNFNHTPLSRQGGFVFCKKCPVPVTFLGFEISYPDVITGDTLAKDDPLYLALSDWGCPEGRYSWDPMTVLLAVTGDEKTAGYDTVSGTASVDPTDGSNRFNPNNNGLHKYVIRNRESSFYKNAINEIIPLKKPTSR